jgi:hypothetical protein
MDGNTTADALIEKVLIHLYNSVVVGSINSSSLILRMQPTSQTMNPRHKDLQELYSFLGPERRRLFYDAVAAMAEFTVYRALYFVEQYNRFDSETNSNEFPRVDVVYTSIIDSKLCQLPISKFGTEELGTEWKMISRRDDIRQLVQSAINGIVG